MLTGKAAAYKKCGRGALLRSTRPDIAKRSSHMPIGRKITAKRGVRKQISARIRFEIFKRDQFTCQYCGAHPPAVILQVGIEIHGGCNV